MTIGMLFVFLLALSCQPIQAASKKTVTIYFFWSEGCPHCKKEKVFLAQMKEKYKGLEVKDFEVKGDPENAALFSRLADAYGVKIKGVPTTFVGDQDPVIGYHDDQTSGRDIEDRIKYCFDKACPDPSARLSGSVDRVIVPLQDFSADQQGLCVENVECDDKKPGDSGVIPGQSLPTDERGQTAVTDAKTVITIPLIGEMDISKTALPLQTFIIAGLDAFNPCAFFVLFTLLGLMIHLQSRKRLLLVGGIFVFFSGFIYFLFMAAWLNIFLLTGQIAAVTFIAGIIALVIAGINIKDFFFFKKGVSLVIPDSAKPKLFDRMRKLMKADSLAAIIGGTIVLAVAANTYELFCTVGFPMVYTRILTLQNLPTFTYYLYLVLYNVIYVIPLALIVLLFAVTLGARKLTEQQGQSLKLISGMMMLGLGMVLVVKPEMMNNIVATGGLLGGSVLLSLVIMAVTKKMSAKTG